MTDVLRDRAVYGLLGYLVGLLVAAAIVMVGARSAGLGDIGVQWGWDVCALGFGAFVVPIIVILALLVGRAARGERP